MTNVNMNHTRWIIPAVAAVGVGLFVKSQGFNLGMGTIPSNKNKTIKTAPGEVVPQGTTFVKYGGISARPKNRGTVERIDYTTDLYEDGVTYHKHLNVYLPYLFCSDNLGYSKYCLPSPKACFPVYSTVEIFRHKKNKEDQYNITALGQNFSEEKVNEYTITKHLTKYPPAYIVACRDDKVVPVEQSHKLSNGLNKLGIINICEIGNRGGHGFGLGTGTDAEGWLERAIKFYESL